VGAGHASPVIADGRLYVFSRQGELELVRAFELASGKQIWQQGSAVAYEMNSAATDHGKGPKATPVVAEGRLYTFGITGVLSAFETASGRLVWRQDFRTRFKASSPSFGAAQSPLVRGGRVYVHVGTDDDGALLALDAATGKEQWAWKGDGPAYASPIAIEVGGALQIVSFGKGLLFGLSAERGELLWQRPFTTPYDQNAVTPVAQGARLIVSGLNNGIEAVDVVRTAAGFELKSAWKTNAVSLYMSSPVWVGARLIGFSNRNKGEFFALDVATGAVLWRSPGRQADNASLIAAGGALLATTTEGELLVQPLEANGWAPTRTYALAKSPIWAHTALAGRLLVTKDLDSVSVWRLD